MLAFAKTPLGMGRKKFKIPTSKEITVPMIDKKNRTFITLIIFYTPKKKFNYKKQKNKIF
jgi:hypothetical protein